MDRRMLQKRGRKVEGSKRRRESWIFFCPLGLAILAACLQPFLLTWLHTSAQDPFCYSRKPTETTHSLYSPSGQHSHSSPHPESQLAVASRSRQPLSPAVPSPASKLSKVERAADSSQPSFWCKLGPGSSRTKKPQNVLCLLVWGEAHPSWRAELHCQREGPSP